MSRTSATPRIAIISDISYPQVDGVNRILDLLVDFLIEQEWRVMFFAPPGNQKINNGIPLARRIVAPSYTMPLYSSYQFSIPGRFLKKRLKEFAPDVIHAINPFILGVGAIKYATENKCPSVASMHTYLPAYTQHYKLGILESASWRYLRWVHNRCSINLAPSNSFARKMKMKGIQRVSVWGGGVDTDAFNPNHRSDALRNDLMNDPSNLLLLHVGRLAREKEVELLQETMQEVDGVELIIVGDGPRRKWLQDVFSDTPTIFAGFKTGRELATIYASADIFVSTSRTETDSLTVIEAMASGLPVVAAHSFGIVDHLAESEAGILVEPGSNKGLKEAIEQLISNPGERLQMATNARKHSESRSWDKCFQRLLQYYKGSMEQTGGRWSGGINILSDYGSMPRGQ